MDHDANDTTIVNIVDLFLLVRWRELPWVIIIRDWQVQTSCPPIPTAGTFWGLSSNLRMMDATSDNLLDCLTVLGEMTHSLA
jgi:hypothetical protein